jgi:hypothetical protein
LEQRLHASWVRGTNPRLCRRAAEAGRFLAGLITLSPPWQGALNGQWRQEVNNARE